MNALSLAALAGAVAAVAALPAAAQVSPARALQEWGLIGRWALRCDLPPSLNNSHDTYNAAADGRVQIVRNHGERGIDRSEISRAEPRADGTLALTIDFAQFNEVQRTVYMKSADRIRIVANRSQKGGVYVENRILRRSGRPTPWRQRCK